MQVYPISERYKIYGAYFKYFKILLIRPNCYNNKTYCM